jgi:hypothetical protein
MEKVQECGLKLSREETRQVGKVGGEEEREETRPQVSGVVVGNLNSMMKGPRDEDTRWQRRAAARHENFDLDSCYDVSEKDLERNLQAICIAVSLSKTVIGA